MSDLDPSRIAWRKSTRSEGANACVEIAGAGGRHLVRDSKNPDGPVLSLTPAQWRMLFQNIKARTHDL